MTFLERLGDSWVLRASPSYRMTQLQWTENCLTIRSPVIRNDGVGGSVPLACYFGLCVDEHEGIQDDQIVARRSASSHRLRGFGAEWPARSRMCARCVAVLPASDGPGRHGRSGVSQATSRKAEQDLREGFDGSRTVANIVIPGCATWRRPGIHNHRAGVRR
jgi:hypothetical protein